MNYLKEFWSSRELLYNLTAREVKGRYKRTALGQLWSLANPLAYMVIYTFIFSFVFKIQPAQGNPSGLNVFALWLLCGLLPWVFFSNTLTAGLGSVLTNAALVQKVYFLRIVLPLSSVGANGFNWLWEMGVLAIALTIAGAFVLPWLPIVLLVMILLALFTAGVALLLSIANVHFRDTQHLVAVFMQIWFYLTPIVYPVSLIENVSQQTGPLWNTNVTVMDIYSLNPLVSFISVFRSLLYDNAFPEVGPFLACVAWGVGAFALGVAVFSRKDRGLAEAL